MKLVLMLELAPKVTIPTSVPFWSMEKNSLASCQPSAGEHSPQGPYARTGDLHRVSLGVEQPMYRQSLPRAYDGGHGDAQV